MPTAFPLLSSNRLVDLPISMRAVSSLTSKLTASETVSPCWTLSMHREHLTDPFLTVAGRTIMHSIITALERIAFNGDPLQFLLIQTTYQPFLSLFHMTGVVDEHPEFKAIRTFELSSFILTPEHLPLSHHAADYSSALVIELRRGNPPDLRDFIRVRFRNGTATPFEDVHVFGHHADIPLTEFIYRAEVCITCFAFLSNSVY
jgi:hypothetical protein